jgi:hypothetical protein
MSQPLLALSDAVATVAAYTTAVQLGLLDRIDREPAGPEELARTCGATERGVRVLLGALVSGGLVERLDDGRYRPALTGLAGYHPLLPMWDHLPDAVRSGVPLADRSPGLALLCGFWEEAAVRVAAALPPASRVLVAAAGGAAWSIAYAARISGARVTAIDAPATLPLTRRAVARAGLADRVDCRPGTVQEATFEPGAYDLILLPQVCNLLDEPACAVLFDTLAPALAPNGTLAVIETLPGGRGAAMRELSLYLRTPGGSMHQVECYERWLREAGLRAVAVAHPDPDLAVITAVR